MDVESSFFFNGGACASMSDVFVIACDSGWDHGHGQSQFDILRAKGQQVRAPASSVRK